MLLAFFLQMPTLPASFTDRKRGIFCVSSRCSLRLFLYLDRLEKLCRNNGGVSSLAKFIFFDLCECRTRMWNITTEPRLLRLSRLSIVEIAEKRWPPFHSIPERFVCSENTTDQATRTSCLGMFCPATGASSSSLS